MTLLMVHILCELKNAKVWRKKWRIEKIESTYSCIPNKRKYKLSCVYISAVCRYMGGCAFMCELRSFAIFIEYYCFLNISLMFVGLPDFGTKHQPCFT